MSRKQGNNWNGYAGIDALKEIRKYKPNVPIFFYIGDVNKTLEKFKEKNCDLEGVQIGNNPKEVRAFLKYEMKAK